MEKIKLPVDAVIALTYKCNSRCIMCDIWKIKEFDELPPEYFSRLPRSLKYINLSGGEPFLCLNLTEIVKVIKKICPKAKIIISSNGFATELIAERMKEVLKIDPAIGVAISIDGVGEMHSEVRGIPGGFEKAMATIRTLKEIGLKNLRLAFTISKYNLSHLGKVYDLANGLGAEFTLALAQSSEFFFGGKKIQGEPEQKELRKQFDYLIKGELQKNSLKSWARAYFAEGLLEFALTGHSPLPARAGKDFFFLAPNGDVYPSVIHNFIMGNLKMEKDFKKIWLSEKAFKVRKLLLNHPEDVWMICTARTAIIKNPLKLAYWIFKKKFFK